MEINPDNLLISLLINAAAIMGGAYLLQGVEVKNFTSAVIASVILSLVNFFIKPVLAFFAFPITFLTLGLFGWVINALMIMLVGWMFSGFRVKNFWWALGFAVLISLINSVIVSILT